VSHWIRHCKGIGDSIFNMHPIDSLRKDGETEKNIEKYIKINLQLADDFMGEDFYEPQTCPFAQHIMTATKEELANKVDCNWGDVAEGKESLDFQRGVGAYYPSTMWSGLFTLPLASGYSGVESYYSRSPGTTPFGPLSTMTNSYSSKKSDDLIKVSTGKE